MYKLFPINPTLLSMDYISNPNANAGDLAIFFKKGQTRTYLGVPKYLAYRLYYTQTAEAMMRLYSTEIKKKFKVFVK